MNQSPAQRHRLRVLAAKQAQQAADAGAHGEATGSAYEMQLTQLHQFRLRLKDVQSLERRAEMKRTMLPEFDDYIDAVLQAAPGVQDDVLATVLLWSLDAGMYDRGLALAKYALEHGLKMPDRFERPVQTIVIDEVGEAVMAGRLAGKDAVRITAEVIAMTDGLDAHDQARAKLYKAAGWALLGKTSSSDVDMESRPLTACRKAMPLLKRAFELDTRTGVKKDIERLERRLKKEA